jgi:hypothetical protein
LERTGVIRSTAAKEVTDGRLVEDGGDDPVSEQLNKPIVVCFVLRECASDGVVYGTGLVLLDKMAEVVRRCLAWRRGG